MNPRTLQTRQHRMQLPVGYRFVPTDEELIHYLRNKIISGSVPADVIQDIEANSFYRQTPIDLVPLSTGEREWYFFINEDDENIPRRLNGSPVRKVENDLGCWKKIGEKTILNAEGEVSATKYGFNYFSQKKNRLKKTHWSMEEYHLPSHIYAENNVQGKIVLAKLMRGTDYNFIDDYA